MISLRLNAALVKRCGIEDGQSDLRTNFTLSSFLFIHFTSITPEIQRVTLQGLINQSYLSSFIRFLHFKSLIYYLLPAAMLLTDRAHGYH